MSSILIHSLSHSSPVDKQKRKSDVALLQKSEQRVGTGDGDININETSYGIKDFNCGGRQPDSGNR